MLFASSAFISSNTSMYFPSRENIVFLGTEQTEDQEQGDLHYNSDSKAHLTVMLFDAFTFPWPCLLI